MVQLKQFGRYEIVRKLGRSMTDVYLATDPAANRPVVLKLIEESKDEFTRLVIDAERRGAQIQRQLHEADRRILEIYDFGELNGCFFVTMEYFDGKNIAEILQTERRLAPERACRYALEVLSQLDRLHAFVSDLDGRRRAVVHGDIKPSNIQIGAQGEVRLLDFGIAKVITYTHNLTHHNLGSPTYCSPERLAKAQVDPQADLWALGVSLYEMVAGAPPYQAQSTRKLENLIQSRRPPRALPPDCPRALGAVVSKALAADLDRRYASAMEFESDLRALLEGRPTAAENERAPSWETNDTVRKSPAEAATLRPATLRRAMEGLATMRASVARWPVFRNDFVRVMWALGAGILFGLFVVMPLSYWYSFHKESKPLRGFADYIHRTPAEIGESWN
ncbi:MAG: serine/threonine-protein kinase, partial [Bryobacteraceae bacterium]